MLQNYGNDMTEKAVRICRAYLPGAWKKITAADVEVNRIRYIAYILHSRIKYVMNLVIMIDD